MKMKRFNKEEPLFVCKIDITGYSAQAAEIKIKKYEDFFESYHMNTIVMSFNDNGNGNDNVGIECVWNGTSGININDDINTLRNNDEVECPLYSDFEKLTDTFSEPQMDIIKTIIRGYNISQILKGDAED